MIRKANIKKIFHHEPVIPRKAPPTKGKIAAQNAICVQDAVRFGRIDRMRWFIQMVVHPQFYHDLSDDGQRAAIYPGNMLPTLRLADDMSGDYAWMLAEIFEATNKAAVMFYPLLTDVQALDRLMPGRWYHWGELRLDAVCEVCGQVYRVEINDEWQGCDCQYPLAAHPRRTFVDGVMYQLGE